MTDPRTPHWIPAPVDLWAMTPGLEPETDAPCVYIERVIAIDAESKWYLAEDREMGDATTFCASDIDQAVGRARVRITATKELCACAGRADVDTSDGYVAITWIHAADCEKKVQANG